MSSMIALGTVASSPHYSTLSNYLYEQMPGATPVHSRTPTDMVTPSVQIVNAPSPDGTTLPAACTPHRLSSHTHSERPVVNMISELNSSPFLFHSQTNVIILTSGFNNRKCGFSLSETSVRDQASTSVQINFKYKFLNICHQFLNFADVYQSYSLSIPISLRDLMRVYNIH